MSAISRQLSKAEAAALREQLLLLLRRRPTPSLHTPDCPLVDLSGSSIERQRDFLERLNGEELKFLAMYSHVCCLTHLRTMAKQQLTPQP